VRHQREDGVAVRKGQVMHKEQRARQYPSSYDEREHRRALDRIMSDVATRDAGERARFEPRVAFPLRIPTAGFERTPASRA
jgi:hypothetical protein